MASKILQARVSEDLYQWVLGHGGMKTVVVAALEAYRERLEGVPVLQAPKTVPARGIPALTQEEAAKMSATGQSRRVMGVYVPIPGASEEIRATWPVRTWKREGLPPEGGE